MQRPTRHFVMLSGTLGLIVASCALFEAAETPLVPGRAAVFPHAIHVIGDFELDCVDCHVGAEEDGRAGMPDLETCLLCHEDLDEGKPLERTVAGFILPGNDAPTWTKATGYRIESAFSHAIHYEAGADCESCHAGAAESDRVSRDWNVTMEECIQCHESIGVEGVGCVDCHPNVDENWAPGSHDGNWVHQHGFATEFAGFPGAAVTANCSVCHKENECQACHQQMEPSDHSEPFRVRGHGFAAALNRDRCIVCHKEDTCVRCHNLVEPRTHNAIWGGRTSAHCVSCHLPLGQDDSCLTCHKSNPSHLLAPGRPPPPHPGPASDCRSCHFPLTHFDNGQHCNLCHF